MSLGLIPIEDERWRHYRGGYNRAIADLTSLLQKLVTGDASEGEWGVLWDELHHQGDVGEASYAVVPYLAEYAKRASTVAWHAFGFPVVVELARSNRGNPKLPAELEASYFAALRELPMTALSRGLDTWDKLCFEPVMASLALSLGRRLHAELYLDLTENEISEFYKYYEGRVDENNI